MDLFDEKYYATGCGAPMRRNELWLNLNNGFADAIVRGINPASALDAGCAMGFLVETLRARGVDARGVDVSAYAISQAHESARPYVRVGRVTEPFERRYDLITCIEVLEHMPREESERAVANLCAHADDILFSSTPDDLTEPTHFNVQPPEYWAEQFARHGFYRDVDFDASFISPWAARFRKRGQTAPAIARDYERALWQARQQNAALRQQMETAPSQPRAVLRATPPARQPSAGGKKTRVLLVAHDVVGKQMAGPGARYFHLARALAPHVQLTFALPHESDGQIELPGAQVAIYTRGVWQTLAPLAQAAQVIILTPDLATDFPQLADLPAARVIDGYDPLMAEWLAMEHAENPSASMPAWRARLRQLQPQFELGDFFICASERQRDWWLGLLEASGRINPLTFGADRSLRNLVDVVPYGLPEYAPQHTRAVIRGVWQGIGEQDKLIVWGGGLWSWLDPLTAIRAVARVWEKRKDVRLVFPGTRHPNPLLGGIRTHTQAAKTLAEELGLLNRAVFFGDWVAYEDWRNVLLECDVALSLHHDSFETQLAFRSRMLEYVWAGLPVVCTRGDATSDLVAQYGVGEVVEYGDVAGVARAIERVLGGADPIANTNNFELARRELTWARAAAPLVAFCQNPRKAADRASLSFKDEPEAGVELAQVKQERDALRELVKGYEAGRFIRLMRWVKSR